MSTFSMRKAGLALTGAAASAAVAIGVPLATAAPTAVAPSDTAGYLDSTARCTAPDTAVLFGTTKSSRIAICKTDTGAYQYRGVRVSDGAKLITPAKQTSADTYVIDNDGVTYTVTPTALSITASGNTFRTETWTDFHSTQASAVSATDKPSPTAPSTTASGTTAPKAASSAAPSAPKSSAAPSPAVPLPPPMAAEAGGSSSAG